MFRALIHGIVVSASWAWADSDYERAPIAYSDSQGYDALAPLREALRTGSLNLPTGSANEVLRALLKHLNIPEASQVLVFSKTSQQNDLITPATPRVLYFGDEVYLGYAQGGMIEAAAIDARLGPLFYSIDPRVNDSRELRFERDNACLSCHGGPFSPDVPGVIIRSVTPGPAGHPLLSQGSRVVDTTTPFEQRWGGWYVTGKHGHSQHMGNTTATEEGERVSFDPKGGQNVMSLASFIDTRPYLRPTSDIVALMVLEHQTSTQTALTKAHHAALRAMHMQQALQKELGESVQSEPVGSARRIIDHAAEDVLDALLFKDEAALPEGGIEGLAEFQTEFEKRAPHTRDARSLKDLQLLTRLFKYRCSYLIYARTFTELESHLKTTVMAKLRATLKEPSERYAYLGDTERAHIRDILAETLKGW